jgi:hypothetical protein
MSAPSIHAALSALGRAAVAYAEHGWHVFPLTPRAKTPLLRGAGGFLSATTDVAQVREWWTRHPHANIGLWPGQSGLVILDLDGPDGTLAAQKFGALSEPTLVCTTGREDGGRHLYFRRPEFSVSNCDLAPRLEVRGDAGYVVVPPSMHPSGKKYAWIGRIDDVRDLPPAVLSVLERAQRTDAAVTQHAPAPGIRPARDIAFDEEISEGGRNKALTRYAGRLLAKGIPEDEALVLVAALNTAKCRPALPQHEVNALVASVAARESRKRVTEGGTTIALVSAASQLVDELPSPADLAAQQIEGARALLTRDIRNAPVWAWHDLSALAGPMLPSEFIVVGALMGNGKSALLMSQMDAFAAAGQRTLYFPLEVDAKVCRLRWAAWKLGLDVRHVIRQDWAKLPEGSSEAVSELFDEQEAAGAIRFASPKRVAIPELVRWCHWGKEHGCSVVMLDHLHRMDFGGDAAGHRVAVTEVVRQLKDLARELDIVLIAAAQLNRSNDPVDAYAPPGLGRLKESAGIAEEADVVLMLSRRLKAVLPDKWAQRLRTGHLSENDIAEPGVMSVMCRKHRLDDSALNHAALLQVVNGRVMDRAPSWRTIPDDARADTREPWDDR